MSILLEIFIVIVAPIVIYSIYFIISGKGKTFEMQAKIAEKKMRDAKKKEERRKKFLGFDDIDNII